MPERKWFVSASQMSHGETIFYNEIVTGQHPVEWLYKWRKANEANKKAGKSDYSKERILFYSEITEENLGQEIIEAFE